MASLSPVAQAEAPPVVPPAPAVNNNTNGNGNSNGNNEDRPGSPAAPPPNQNYKTGDEVEPLKEERSGLIREVGCQAIWSLSSCKPGYGVDQLRDSSLENYWQSDGQLPHLVNVQFRRKMTIRDICIYTDFKLDESYTPSKISVRCGTHFNDLQEVEVVEFTEPSGWVQIFLKDIRSRPISTFMLQLAILSNHQNGRDTHLRQVRIHSPVENLPAMVFPGAFAEHGSVFKTFSSIR